MSTHKGCLMIAILAAMSFGIVIPAYAAYLEQACPDCTTERLNQQEALKSLLPVLVWTDKTTYDHQSTIKVTGHVKDPNPTQHLTLKVIDPEGGIVKVDQVPVDTNGDFEVELKTASSLWKKNGLYTIRVQYGTDIKSNQVKVELMGEVGGACGESQLAVNLGNKSYCIPYSVDGKVMVSSGILDTSAKSLIVNIKAESDGSVSLDIPRSVLDAKSSGADDILIVLLDGEEVKIQETKTPTTRTITIPLVAGNEKIEIIGTQIVPEFGTIAALVLAIAIISIIAVSAKTRLRLMPKY